MRLGLKYAKNINADILLATDPDCDRVGVAVKDGPSYKCLTGNEVGVLLLDYVCSQKIKHDRMVDNPLMIKTIVTTEMAERIADYYGVKTINVLTGFKYIGEQIGYLESKKETKRYVFGFEESCGYLSGSYVRDKDAVNGVLLICEMLAYYKTMGLTLIDKLNELYTSFGFYSNSMNTVDFEGISGMQLRDKTMQYFRNGINSLGRIKVDKVIDYQEGVDGLPKENVLKFYLADGNYVVIRPSGTEPKLKIYLSTHFAAADKEKAHETCSAIFLDIEGRIKSIIEYQ